MKKVYISSTYTDLTEHRRAVYDTLRKMRLDPISMEDYPSIETRPLDKCLRDIKKADLYIGIFAWRYGYVPNPSDGKSITECEYEAAGNEGKHRLIFLSGEAARWPANFIDGMSNDSGGNTKILALRERLKTKHTVRFFETPDELAALAATSVYNYLTKDSIAEALDKAIDIQIKKDAIEANSVADSSGIQAIFQTIADSHARALRINLGTGWSWWSTRLYLLIALALDVTDTELLIFFDSDEKNESNIKTWIRKQSLAKMLDGILQTTLIDLDRKDHFVSALVDVVQQSSAYVAVTYKEHLRIVERHRLNASIAHVLLDNWSSLMMS